VHRSGASHFVLPLVRRDGTTLDLLGLVLGSGEAKSQLLVNW